jgi:hypothetical protein
MATQGMTRKNSAGLKAAAMSASLNFVHRHGQLVKRKDGSIVEMRPGFRPRVLSREEVEALKAQFDAERAQEDGSDA